MLVIYVQGSYPAASFSAVDNTTGAVTSNGGAITLSVGDSFTYSWVGSPSNASVTCSYYVSAGPNGCREPTSPISWTPVASVPLGGSRSGTIQSCQAGNTYVYSYVVTSGGNATTSLMTATVTGSAAGGPPTPNFTALPTTYTGTIEIPDSSTYVTEPGFNSAYPPNKNSNATTPSSSSGSPNPTQGSGYQANSLACYCPAITLICNPTTNPCPSGGAACVVQGQCAIYGGSDGSFCRNLPQPNCPTSPPGSTYNTASWLPPQLKPTFPHSGYGWTEDQIYAYCALIHELKHGCDGPSVESCQSEKNAFQASTSCLLNAFYSICTCSSYNGYSACGQESSTCNELAGAINSQNAALYINDCKCQGSTPTQCNQVCSQYFPPSSCNSSSTLYYPCPPGQCGNPPAPPQTPTPKPSH
jgi:hypothetical protein